MNFSTANRQRGWNRAHYRQSWHSYWRIQLTILYARYSAVNIPHALCAPTGHTKCCWAKYVKKAEKLMQSVCESKGNHSILLGWLRIVVRARVCDGIFKWRRQTNKEICEIQQNIYTHAHTHTHTRQAFPLHNKQTAAAAAACVCVCEKAICDRQARQGLETNKRWAWAWAWAEAVSQVN